MRIGIQELLLIFVVALIVLGPDKLPMYARKFGEALSEFRKFSSDATKDIRESIVEPLEEAQRPLREALEPITELEKEVRGDVKGIQKSLSDIGKPVKTDAAPKEAHQGSQAQESGTPATQMDALNDGNDGKTDHAAPDTPNQQPDLSFSPQEEAAEEEPAGQISIEQQAV